MGADEPAFDKLPIIALTANAVAGMSEMFMEKGFSGFLPKPIDTVRMNTLLEQWIPKEKQKTHKTSSVAPSGKSFRKLIEVEGLDTAKGLRLFDGNEDMYYETLDVFVDDGYERIGKIRASMKAQDLELYTTHVHALKSAAASIGADQVSKTAQKLEIAGQQGDLFYLETCSESFLNTLEFLIGGISASLLALRRDNPDDIAAEPLDELHFDHELTQLKASLDNFDIAAVDRSVDILMKSARSDEEKSAARKVSKHILMGEFDEAAELVDMLVAERGWHSEEGP
jgi:HPt (histidine-containing phosphotransfer) domain-containing protein